MITDSNASQPRHRSVLSRPLKRGAACMNCRFLKIKCDATRPICGPCRKHPKDDPCEYSDGPARSRTKALEDTVQRLEARLHELENPDLNTPPVALHDPYGTFRPPRLTIPNNPFSHGTGYHSLPSTPYGGTMPSASPEPHLARLSPLSVTDSSPLFGGSYASPLGIFDSRAVAVATPDSSVSSHLEINDSQVYDVLIHIFLPHASQFGFFLDPQRVLSSPSTTSDLARTSPALLFTLCAFGAHLSRPTRDRTSEDRFLLRALRASAAGAPSDHSLVHAIQAEVLLAYYFWRTGGLLRARVHASSAGAMVLGAGLHCTMPSTPPPVLELTASEDHIDERRLHAPTDALEAGERIRAFWAVFLLQKSLAVVLDKPSEVCGVFEQVAIDVPWPSELEEVQLAHAEGTVKQFLAGQHDPASASVNAMVVKAHVLLHRAVYMQGQWQTATATGQQPPALVTAFQSLEGLVATLRTQLPPRYPDPARRSPASVHSQSPSEQIDNRVRLAHTLLDGATLRLHEIFVCMYGYGDHSAHTRYVQTAMELLRDADGSRAGHPIVSSLWSAATIVLADELKWVRQKQQDYDYEYDKELRGCLAAGMAALASGAEGSAVMRRDYARAREAAAELGPL